MPCLGRLCPLMHQLVITKSDASSFGDRLAERERERCFRCQDWVTQLS